MLHKESMPYIMSSVFINIWIVMEKDEEGWRNTTIGVHLSIFWRFASLWTRSVSVALFRSSTSYNTDCLKAVS